MAINSIQSNIKNSNSKDMTKYSLFLGGMDVTNAALQQYDPLRTGYARIFIVKKPKFLESIFLANPGSNDEKRYKSFWHMLEYGFTSFDGIQGVSLDFEQLTGGYAGRSVEIPTLARDETNAVTMRAYEMAGSPIREMLDLWITGISDPYTGLTHYHGALDMGVAVGQYNQTAEMIYVQTDSTGNSNNIEYACMLCNMVPKQVRKDQFNYESGSHPLVQLDIEFTATKYESVQINQVAKELLKRQNILANYTYFKSEYLDAAGNASDTIADRANVDIRTWATDPAALTK